MNQKNPFWNHWSYGGVCCSPVLVVLGIPHFSSWPIHWVAIYLLLPLYMIHQIEEHYQDRFRLFFNQTLGQGLEILTPVTVWVTNVIGVWGVLSLVFLVTVYGYDKFAAIGPALLLTNAIVHILHAIKFRCYNPGLWTAIFAFLPMGLWTLTVIPEQSFGVYFLCFLSMVLLHVWIVIHAIRRLKVLKAVSKNI